jgi:hypothetical protein
MLYVAGPKSLDRGRLWCLLWFAAVAVAGAGCHQSGSSQTTDAQAGTGGGATGGGAAAGAAGTMGAGGADARAWASWPMPNPVPTGLPNPQSYDTGTPGVVIDRVTGLMWQRNVDPGSRLWADAYAYCDGLSLGGHDDWRLPVLIELVSIVDFTQEDPSIDATAFPATPVDSFWTAAPVVGSPGDFWYILFTTGFNYPGHADFLPLKVRCVR